MAFLRTEYKYLGAYVSVFFILLLALYTIEPPLGDKLDGVRYASSFLAVHSFRSRWMGWNDCRHRRECEYNASC
jgi:hypothetical protein